MSLLHYVMCAVAILSTLLKTHILAALIIVLSHVLCMLYQIMTHVDLYNMDRHDSIKALNTDYVKLGYRH